MVIAPACWPAWIVETVAPPHLVCSDATIRFHHISIGTYAYRHKQGKFIAAQTAHFFNQSRKRGRHSTGAGLYRRAVAVVSMFDCT
jgi:hypothetical protein